MAQRDPADIMGAVEELAQELKREGACHDCGAPIGTMVEALAHAAPNGFTCDLYRQDLAEHRKRAGWVEPNFAVRAAALTIAEEHGGNVHDVKTWVILSFYDVIVAIDGSLPRGAPDCVLVCLTPRGEHAGGGIANMGSARFGHLREHILSFARRAQQMFESMNGIHPSKMKP